MLICYLYIKFARNKNYAPILISHTVKESTDKDFKTFIFKKEDNPLPFNYICKCKYYVYNIPNNIMNNNPTNVYSLKEPIKMI